MSKENYLKEVRNQYENYPYPPRNPEDEKRLFYTSDSSALDAVNHICFNGEESFDKGFRVLIAGGGTGDCTLFLAEQLKDKNAEVVYLDFSEASMEVAQARAKVRGLDNIKWVRESILNIPKLDLGEFDFITTTGVLHHLEDPDAGLAALKSVLSPRGALFVMVYATTGRAAVYQMQDLMRKINVNTDSIEEKIENTKKTLGMLPPGNWFHFNGNIFKHDLASDNGIYDLLLHSQDRSYTVPEFFDFFEKQELVLSKLTNSDHQLGAMTFYPPTFFRDQKLLSSIMQMPYKEQAAICELMFGQVIKQEGYAGHTHLREASLDDMDMVPSFSIRYVATDALPALKQAFLNAQPQIQVNQIMTMQRTPNSTAIFDAIDGERSIGEIIELVEAANSSAKGRVLPELKLMLNQMIMLKMVYLRKKGVPAVTTISEIKSRKK